MRHTIALLILLSTACSAQRVSIGAKGGLPIGTDYYGNESRPVVYGPSVEFHLPAGFAVEFDALYQRTGYSASFSYSPGAGTSASYQVRERGNNWQFPLLGKFYFRSRQAPWRPFLGTGYAFRSSWNHSETVQTITDSEGTHTYNPNYDSRSPFDVGAVIAAGVRFRLGRIAIAPEMRYTRWGSGGNTYRKNQGAFLLGISF
jgi:hypothetical protein